MNHNGRALQAGVLALGLVGLLVLVAIGARAGHPIGHAHLHQREVPARVGNDLLTSLVIVWGLGIVVFVAAVYFLSREEWEQPERNWLKNFIVTLVVIGCFGFIGYELVHRGHFGRHGQSAPGGGATVGTPGGKLPKLPTARKPATFDWEFAVALAGIAVLTAAYVASRAPSPSRLSPSTPPSSAPTRSFSSTSTGARRAGR